MKIRSVLAATLVVASPVMLDAAPASADLVTDRCPPVNENQSGVDPGEDFMDCFKKFDESCRGSGGSASGSGATGKVKCVIPERF